MDDSGTDALRKLAPSWTLAGDEKLLSILQNTHQRLVSKCQEANSQLEQMATALNDASISLQNVNNQFMALSSSQFIESRVYDDDDLATDVPAVKEPPKPEVPDELTSLKRSISVLENAHEIITILQDSDTESDTDDEMPARMVLKPKDMYANRPLPYIIGSQAWKNKWHAGLILEDSDSDSSASKVEHDSDQYSQSEPEDTHTDKLPLPIHTQSTVSETSSELPSEQGSVPKPTPSDVASEIARRLGAREPVRMVEREPEEEEPPKPIVRKIYRPQDPISTTIFPDEPPPLSSQSDSDSDIFAALHRAPRAPRAPRPQLYDSSDVAAQLFPEQAHSDHADIFSDFANKPASNSTANSSSIFDAGPEPNMFVKHSDSRHTSDRHRKHIQDADHTRQAYDHDDSGNVYEGRGGGDDFRGRGEEEAERGVKKPIGGISVFGNKGTESIGAAILKRNQRKSSTSADESGSDSRSESQSNQQIRTEKDIFDDLFARSESQKVTKEKDFSKDLKNEIKKKAEVKEKKIEKPKVDLFSDNLFDDIDDIFSTNVVKMPAKDTAKPKSIFEDDDDLFAEIAAPKPMKVEVASSSNKNKKSLFDSDDELFFENTPEEKPKESPKPVEINKPKVAERTKVNENSNVKKEITKSIFDDDDDEDDLFSDLKTNEVSKVQNKPVSLENSRDVAKEDKTKVIVASTKNVFKSPSLFDDDDESDLFAEPAKSSNFRNVIAVPIKETKVSSQSDDENPTKLSIQSHEETFTKLSSQTDKEISKKPSSKTDEKILTKNSSPNEVKIPEEIVYDTPSSPVKTDENKKVIVEKNIDIEKEHNKSIVDKIVNTSETEKNFENKNSDIPVNKNVDSKRGNVESNAARIFDHIKNIEQSSSDTNNDFSDQDFDDLPPKEEENKTVVNDSNKITEKQNIFDKVTLEEDIDELFVTSQQNTAKTETIFNTIPDFIEPITEKTEPDNKKEEITPKTIEADIFSNIITEPPVFEKPKEPKKSKNVNALFDDDSDDESLFFKKNDPIFVEHPAEFTPTQDRIFGLFTDEPPDDGFSKISDEFDDDMFSTVPKPKILQHEYPPIPNTKNFDDSTSTKNKIPEIVKSDPVKEINSDFPKDEEKPAVEIKKEHTSDTEKDIFKQPTEENIDKGQNSSSVLSEDEQLFKITSKESKPVSREKPSLDFLSDDDNLFASKPKVEKPNLLTPKPEPVPHSKNITTKDKTTPDPFSDDENLFASKSTSEKASLETNKDDKTENKNLYSKNKASLDIVSDDENLFAPKPTIEKSPMEQEKPVPENIKPSLKEKPSLDFLSDDENLFTVEPTLEKPPLVQTVPKNENITIKDKPTSNLSSDEENLFTSVHTLEKPTKQVKPVLGNQNQESVSKSSDDELFSSLEKTEIPKLSENRLLQQDSKSDEDLFKAPAKPEFKPKSSDSKPEKSEKKVGKLKVGLNINVNALLPGASPKKNKPNDQPDGQVQSEVESQKSEPKIHSVVRKPEPKIHSEVRKPEPEIPSQNSDSKLLKSVSFDGKPESDVLDNKLSKERAKIQVKRRPSTRRARREAVRKSGIDFGEDSTDNSSSIDDPPRKHPEVSKEVAKAITQHIHTDTPGVQAKVDDMTVQAKADPILLEKEPKVEPEPVAVETQPKIEREGTDKPTYSRDIKSKVVYILNDEDIFNTSPVESISQNITKNLDSNIGVSTLGKAYPERSAKKDAKSSLFGEDNDEKMFKPKTVVKKSTIFDSDSEEDLFGSTSKREERKVEKLEVKKEIKREVVKGSLFSDEDEDDDLFGVKTKKIVDQKPQPTRPTVKETPKPSEPVFEDPLSMFGDDD